MNQPSRVPDARRTSRNGAWLACAALLLLQAASLSAQAAADTDERGVPRVAIGGGVFTSFPESEAILLHALLGYEHPASQTWSLAGEVGLVFDDSDRLLGSVAAMLKVALLPRARISPYVTAGPALFGTGAGTAFLLQLGAGVRIPLDDGDIAIGLRVHSDALEFGTAFLEFAATFGFPM